jgi:autotransporter-associated beta strand protein
MKGITNLYAAPCLSEYASLLAFLLTFIVASSNAGSATWNLNPASGDWNTATNWTPSTVPNGPADTATFSLSDTTAVSLSASAEVNSIVFSAEASAFTITTSSMFSLDISGTGITNCSGLTQNFIAAVDARGKVGVIRFSNSATAGSQTAFTNNGSLVGGGFGGITRFFNSSTAGNGTFTTNGGAVSTANGGFTQFFDSSTAANAVFTTNGGAVSGASSAFTQFFDGSSAANGIFITKGGAVGAGSGGTQFFGNSTAGYGNFTTDGGLVSSGFGGVMEFLDRSTAGNGTFTNKGGAVTGAGGGETEFVAESDAGNATLIAKGGLAGGAGGTIFFFDDSTGGTACVGVFGDGSLDISPHNIPGVAVGSIEGSGNVFLGANNLSVGSNNRSTTFSGVIQDGGISGGAGGSFTKIGAGTLTLASANTYTRGTTIEGGRLWVNNMSGSGTGSGGVQVNAGTLGGRGTITGAVTVGTGSGAGAVLAPGRRGGKPGGNPLSILSMLTCNSDATYEVGLNTRGAIADEVVADGVTINSAQFSLVDRGRVTLTQGTVFTVIDNTAATPIAGTFSNLADGSTFTQGRNTFQVSYEGGNGNDLTLTVVP